MLAVVYQEHGAYVLGLDAQQDFKYEVESHLQILVCAGFGFRGLFTCLGSSIAARMQQRVTYFLSTFYLLNFMIAQ